MLSLFKPWLTKTKIVDITIDDLKKLDIAGLVLDVDNTIVPWNDISMQDDVMEWIDRVRICGFKICLLSNNKSGRIKEMTQLLGVYGIHSALKPFPFSFLRAAKHMGIPARKCLMIGDQLFTDVVGGNMVGMKTMLVDPISRRELGWTGFVRRLERRLLNREHRWREDSREDES